MPNPEHVEILKQGAEAWNRWREENPNIRPDLSKSIWREHVIPRIDFRFVDFFEANLNGADLRESTFAKADLSFTSLVGADLRNANLWQTIVHRSDLTEADLRGAHLTGTHFWGVDFSGTDLNEATIGATTFCSLDLSQAKGLHTVKHFNVSAISADTLYLSRGDLPAAFLRGAGFPDTFISDMKAIIGAMEPIQFYSCFISHSSKDQGFVQQLRTDLMTQGVTHFYSPEDMKIGDHIRSRIDESIYSYDKLLLILSEHSIASDWVEQEVETALEIERERKTTVLFPIQLDDAVMNCKFGWAAHIKRTRHIGDFTRWKDHDAYQKAFERLLCDLRAESTTKSTS